MTTENQELWDRINSETEMLRRRTTPIHVQQRILSSLPDEPPGKAPSWKRPFEGGPLRVFLVLTLLFVVGAAVGMLLR